MRIKVDPKNYGTINLPISVDICKIDAEESKMLFETRSIEELISSAAAEADIASITAFGASKLVWPAASPIASTIDPISPIWFALTKFLNPRQSEHTFIVAV